MRVVSKYGKGARPGEKSVYIGRPSPLRNPFVLGKDGDRSEVIRRFRVYAAQALEEDAGFQRAFDALVGVDVLVCFCAPLACHGDVLIEMFEKGTSV